MKKKSPMQMRIEEPQKKPSKPKTAMERYVEKRTKKPAPTPVMKESK